MVQNFVMFASWQFKQNFKPTKMQLISNQQKCNCGQIHTRTHRRTEINTTKLTYKVFTFIWKFAPRMISHLYDNIHTELSPYILLTLSRSKCESAWKFCWFVSNSSHSNCQQLVGLTTNGIPYTADSQIPPIWTTPTPHSLWMGTFWEDKAVVACIVVLGFE